MAKKELKTYDEIALDILKKIEPASMKQFSEALNMGNPPYSIVKSLLEKGLITKNIGRRPYTYTIKEKANE